jgi:hypothetical protein
MARSFAPIPSLVLLSIALAAPLTALAQPPARGLGAALIPLAEPAGDGVFDAPAEDAATEEERVEVAFGEDEEAGEAVVAAEAEGHHPDLHLTGYRHLKIELTTHAIGGLSDNDFILAAKIDALLGESGI